MAQEKGLGKKCAKKAAPMETEAREPKEVSAKVDPKEIVERARMAKVHTF